MEQVYVFLIRNDVWIFILCGFGLVWYLGQFIRSRRLLRSAMFGLELERGYKLRNRALVVILILSSIAAIVIYVNLQIAPTLPAELLKPPTPTPNIFATPLSSPTPVSTANSRPTLVVAPTVTLGAPPVATELADPLSPEAPQTNDNLEATQEDPANTLPDIELGNCTPGINISAPPNGVTASGTITFFGSASTDNFTSYDLEAFGPSTEGSWASLTESGFLEPVSDGILATIDLSDWLSGQYLFRLVVYDTNDNLAGQCAVQVSLETDNS